MTFLTEVKIKDTADRLIALDEEFISGIFYNPTTAYNTLMNIPLKKRLIL